MPWLTSTSTYLPNELANNHVPYTDSNGACLPSMASFRSQQATTYPSNGSEPTVPTGEALGKALQSVRASFPRNGNEEDLRNFFVGRSIRANIHFLQHRQNRSHHLRSPVNSSLHIESINHRDVSVSFSLQGSSQSWINPSQAPQPYSNQLHPLVSRPSCLAIDIFGLSLSLSVSPSKLRQH